MTDKHMSEARLNTMRIWADRTPGFATECVDEIDLLRKEKATAEAENERLQTEVKSLKAQIVFHMDKNERLRATLEDAVVVITEGRFPMDAVRGGIRAVLDRSKPTEKPSNFGDCHECMHYPERARDEPCASCKVGSAWVQAPRPTEKPTQTPMKESDMDDTFTLGIREWEQEQKAKRKKKGKKPKE